MSSKRPYTFLGEWFPLNTEVAREQQIGYHGHEAYICITDAARGLLSYVPGAGWFGELLCAQEDRCYWSTSYRHRGKILNKDAARDLIEAALVGASLFGVTTVGQGGTCP